MRPTLLCLALVATPLQAATEAQYRALLAADRSFAERARGKDLVTALTATFDEDVVLIAGGGPGIARGKAAARERLRARPDNLISTVTWSPVAGGISADGSQGYTYGGMTVAPAGKPAQKLKYLAYWIMRPQGWRVFAYKRAGGAVEPLAVAPPVIGRDRRRTGALAALKTAEKAFSDDAQRIGLRAAFARWARAESINIGAAPQVGIGPEQVSTGVAGPEPTSPVSWAADEAIVAPSGDMGLTWGLLRPNASAPDQAPFPFITVWARPTKTDGWRYVAE